MYCGDETGSFVGDLGSHTCRFGYGGEDAPKYVIPSYTYQTAKGGGSRVAASSSLRWNEPERFQSVLRTCEASKNSNPNQPIVDPRAYQSQGDRVEDWDVFETLWESAFSAMRVRDPHKWGSTRSTTTTEGSTSTKVGANPTNNSNNERVAHPILLSLPGCSQQAPSESEDATATSSTSATNTNDRTARQHRDQLVQATEILMEKMDCPALFIAPQPMLASFSHGRPTALVVDVGAGGCRVTPVVDGLVLQRAQRRNGRGGDWLSNVCWEAIHRQQKNNTEALRPHYQLRAPKAIEHVVKTAGGNIFHRWAMNDMMAELRTSPHVHVPAWRSDPSIPFQNLGNTKKTDDDDVEMADESTDSNTVYELPDGTKVDMASSVGKDICRLPELLFTDQVPFVSDIKQAGSTTGSPSLSLLDESSSSNSNTYNTLSNLPLHKLVKESLAAVTDVDIRKELAGNILLTGAASAGLEERLSLELSRTIPGAYKPKVVASKHSVERACASWIGGSIMTSLGSFQQLWLSKTEYEEYGANLAIQRFP